MSLFADNSLANKNILDLTEFKAFVDNKFNFSEVVV